MLIAWSLLLGTGGFVFFGSLSDKIGRKPIILGGCLIAALTYFPLFELLSAERQPGARQRRMRRSRCRWSPTRRPARFQFDPVGTRSFTEPCDVAQAALARAAVNYAVEAGAGRRGGRRCASARRRRSMPADSPTFAARPRRAR